MDFIIVNETNIDQEHICCAISDKKGENCVGSKKAWLMQRFSEGLVFLKADVRGKAFIEYIPAEYAWCPIDAPGYMLINCLWVSGQLKGQGLSNELMARTIEDAKAKGKLGLCALTSAKKKMPFLSDPKYLAHKGFTKADEAAPFYELVYLPFGSGAPVPRFKPSVKQPRIEEEGMVLYYTNQCPFTDKYAPLLDEVAQKRGQKVMPIKLESAQEAQNAPAPFTTYSFFYGGAFVTNEILSAPKFNAFMDEHGL